MEETINPQNQPAPMPVLPEKKKGGLLATIVVVLLIALASGAAAALYTGIWSPAWNPFKEDPDKVIAEMIAKMQTVKTSRSALDVTADIKNDNPGKLVSKTIIDSDIADPENPKSQGEASFSFTGDLFGTGSEQTISVKAKTINIGNDQYVNFESINVPSLDPFLAMLGINLNDIKGSWIKLPNMADAQQEQPSPEMLASLQKMQKMIIGTKFYNVKEQLPGQAIDGKSVYRYLVILDNDKTAQLIENLLAEIEKSSPASVGEDVDMTKESIKESLDKLGQIQAELSIGKSDRFLYRVKLEKNIDLSKLNGENQGTVDVIFEMNGSKFNQPLNILAPAELKTLQEFFPQLGDVISNLIPVKE